MIVHVFPDGSTDIEWEVGDRGRVRDPTPEELDQKRERGGWGYHPLKCEFGKEFVVTNIRPREYPGLGPYNRYTQRILVGMEPGKFSKEGWPCPALWPWDMRPLHPLPKIVFEPDEAKAHGQS
uniref:Uncharacterized protein n=1 Tax=Caulobacter phage BL57 TaxID=3348355 RepID=A0AB74UN73_9VIRU